MSASAGNRTKGVRFELALPPELVAEARAVAGDEALSVFVRRAVEERVARVKARRARSVREAKTATPRREV